MGLVAKTQQGIEILGELNWDGVTSPNGVPEGLCVPQNLELFLSVSVLFKKSSYFTMITSMEACLMVNHNEIIDS